MLYNSNYPLSKILNLHRFDEKYSQRDTSFLSFPIPHPSAAWTTSLFKVTNHDDIHDINKSRTKKHLTPKMPFQNCSSNRYWKRNCRRLLPPTIILNLLLQNGYRGGGWVRRSRTAKKRDMCETKVTGRMVGVRKDRRTDGRCRWWQTRGGTEEDEVGGNPTPGRTEGNVRAPLPASVPFPTTSSSLLSSRLLVLPWPRSILPQTHPRNRESVGGIEMSLRVPFIVSLPPPSPPPGETVLWEARENSIMSHGVKIDGELFSYFFFPFLFSSFLSRERKVIKKLRILKDDW